MACSGKCNTRNGAPNAHTTGFHDAALWADVHYHLPNIHPFHHHCISNNIRIGTSAPLMNTTASVPGGVYPPIMIWVKSPSPLYPQKFHSWCRYCSTCWLFWWSIWGKLVWCCMSGCYVPCLPYPDPSFLWHRISVCYLPFLLYPDLLPFLNLFGVIGIFLCAYCVVWCLLFYFKSIMKFQQDSSIYYH